MSSAVPVSAMSWFLTVVLRTRAIGGCVVMALAPGCAALQVPEARLPQRPFTVVDRPAVRVGGDVLGASEPAVDEPEAERSASSSDRTGSAAGLDVLARAPSRPEGSNASVDWSDHRQAVFDENMRQHFPDWQSSWCPLVLDFEGGGVTFDSTETGARFDAGGTTPCERFDWPDPNTPWLVRDLDGNGTIDGGHELFGTGTRMPDGTFAPNGFAALAVLDDDGDGWITPADAAWSSLFVWTDHDRNRRTDPGELHSLDGLGVTALALDYDVDRRCDARGNCRVEQGRFVWMTDSGAPGVGQLVDVHLACRG
jgi:hypothetical protein